MSRRRAIVVAVLALAVMLVQVVLVRAMAHGHVAHVLLGAGNASPPICAALLAVALVVARFVAIVVAPGALLASLTSLLAHVLVGPRYRDGAGSGSGTSSGTGVKPDGQGSGPASTTDGTGLSMEGRAT